jgi:hypothetical protein
MPKWIWPALALTVLAAGLIESLVVLVRARRRRGDQDWCQEGTSPWWR